MEASYRNHINVVFYLPYFTNHAFFFQNLNYFIRKLTRRLKRTIFKSNSYPKRFVGFCIKMFLHKVSINKELLLKASKEEPFGIILFKIQF